MKKILPISIILAIIFAIVKLRRRASILLGKISNKPPKVELKYSKKLKPEERPILKGSDDAAFVSRQIWSDQIEIREEFVILLLDNGNKVLGYHLLSRGGLTETIVDLKLLFSLVLQSLATSIILVHNHPSGNLKPSESDKKMTRKINMGAKRFDLKVLDHIILTKESYFSFADNGILQD